MPSASQAATRDRRGRLLPGNSPRTIRQARIAARLKILRSEYDPTNTASATDRHRLELAAMHFVHAETTRDPNVSVRSTHMAEILLAKITRSPPAEALPDPTAETIPLLELARLQRARADLLLKLPPYSDSGDKD
jgi:hypothetical protein